ncbi:uncharacterized protein EI90DRAFT_3035681 [Cantharellus anzutake]|uniref:uncharacterized protein n=1 Tax=Cantharellus anzutake TaxID=1750568 RepID=UPI0019049C61|nr:uncharacterized protein EI90DRAFT_3035681 [Cantharellus anzutake]KAF8340466.1 hypothetical protein EI90DRAFT_3035681 [Cantharellus anzutake]
MLHVHQALPNTAKCKKELRAMCSVIPQFKAGSDNDRKGDDFSKVPSARECQLKTLCPTRRFGT